MCSNASQSKKYDVQFFIADWDRAQVDTHAVELNAIAHYARSAKALGFEDHDLIEDLEDRFPDLAKVNVTSLHLCKKCTIWIELCT